MASKNKQAPEPTEEEIEEQRDENRESLREGYDLAKETFGVAKPTFDMAIAMSQILNDDDGDSSRDAIVGLMKAATDQVKKLGTPVDIVPATVAIFDILNESEDSAKNLTDAATEAMSLFGSDCSFETKLDVYYQIYGADEEE